jgi:hypothetical protein
MATYEKAEIADKALEILGVKAAGQDSIAEDANRAQESVDSVYQLLRREDLAPFPVSSVPDWAYSAMAHLVALDLAPMFGVGGERLQATALVAATGRAELIKQANIVQADSRVEAVYF